MKTDTLCEGYAVFYPDHTEVLFAKVGNRVLESDRHPVNRDFDTEERVWYRVSSLPVGIEFIGNYPAPLDERIDGHVCDAAERAVQ